MRGRCGWAKCRYTKSSVVPFVHTLLDFINSCGSISSIERVLSEAKFVITHTRLLQTSHTTISFTAIWRSFLHVKKKYVNASLTYYPLQWHIFGFRKKDGFVLVSGRSIKWNDNTNARKHRLTYLIDIYPSVLYRGLPFGYCLTLLNLKPLISTIVEIREHQLQANACALALQ